MARPAKFSVDDLLDGALVATHERGHAATVADVAARVGAPIGSIYHRFANREELFATLWIRSIRRFQAGLLATLDQADARAALLAGAAFIPRYCREHPAEAMAMTLYRQTDLLATGPATLRDEVATLNDEVTATMLDLGARAYGGSLSEHQRDLLVVACLESPYGLVRRYLGSPQPVPPWLEDVSRAAAAAILALGDTTEGDADPKVND